MLTVNNARILAVDDREDNLMLIEDMLAAQQYEVETATSGEKALSMIEETAFDLVLLDIMMPDMNGFDVLRGIRETYSMVELPVIIVSALSDTKDVMRGLQKEANDYVEKPLQMGILRVRVETQLRLKRMADERQQLVDALEQANAVQKNLMRVASHDLKAPLHNIALVHTLLSEAIKDPESANMLSVAHKSVDTMLTIVEEFLELDVLRDDDIDVSLQPVALPHVLSEVVLEHQGAAENKSIQIETDLPDLTVEADPRRLKQVLTNLISNAVKYSPYNSSVRIQVAEQANEVEVHVLDSGDGIPPEEQDKLFQPFCSISTEPTGGEPSTGLGLWIAQQMIKLQNGEIGFASPSEGGSDFWIRLPKLELTPVKSA